MENDASNQEVKTCSKCRRPFAREAFSTYLSRSRGLRTRSACRLCEYERGQRYNNTHREEKRRGYKRLRQKKLLTGGDELLRFVFLSRMGQFRKTTKEKGLSPIDIDANFLLELYHRQSGLCFYTGRKMLYGQGLGIKQSDSMSVDRKDPNKGYTKDNVVLCTDDINTMKGHRSVEEFQAIIANLNTRAKNWK